MLRHLAKFKNQNPDSKSLAGVEFESAKNTYNSQNYAAAAQQFSQYIANYPNNTNTFEARYYLGESYYRLGEDSKAIQVYQQVISEGKAAKLNKAVERLGDLLYKQKDYSAAIDSYTSLLDQSKNKKEAGRAREGFNEKPL